MSGATYRIDVKHKPQMQGDEWMAMIVRLSDGLPMDTVWASDAERAAYKAKAWIAEHFAAAEPFSLFVDDEGRDADAHHSVKA